MKQFSVEVKVTQDHINKATKASCSKCVVALATIDAIARLKKIGKARIEVSTLPWNTAIRINKSICFAARNSEDIKQLIYDFDAGREIEPITFTTTFLKKNMQWNE